MFNGKIIFNPSGKAGEYSYWAANFFDGCSNDCEYCYCKKSKNWSNKAILKSNLINLKIALEIFESEVKENVNELRKHALFFSFSSDPMLPETIELTKDACNICFKYEIPVKILTKRTDWDLTDWNPPKELTAFGFTITGHDELESNASSNYSRINKLNEIFNLGYKTFASIEPIINIYSSLGIIKAIQNNCHLIKIGLLNDLSSYNELKLNAFIDNVKENCKTKIYFKDSLLNFAKIERSDLNESFFVNRNYNIFENE